MYRDQSDTTQASSRHLSLRTDLAINTVTDHSIRGGRFFAKRTTGYKTGKCAIIGGDEQRANASSDKVGR